MKRLFALLVLAFILPVLADAQTATTRIDTLQAPKYTGDAGKYVATWVISLGTSNDTLQPPWSARYFELWPRGAAGDTLQISYAQTGGVHWSEFVPDTARVISRDFGGAFIKKLYLKANRTAKVIVRLAN